MQRDPAPSCFPFHPLPFLLLCLNRLERREGEKEVGMPPLSSSPRVSLGNAIRQRCRQMEKKGVESIPHACDAGRKERKGRREEKLS